MAKEFFLPDLPIINNKFICIVDHNARVLAASVCSYLSEPNHYLPIFAFPSVGPKNLNGINDSLDEDYGLARDQAKLYSTYLNNVLAGIGGCEYLIFAGLSEDQKSYLHFFENQNVIDIESIENVDFFLSAFNEKQKIIECKSSELLTGLIKALRTNSLLKINEMADSHSIVNNETEGIVVIEESDYVESIIAIDYAISVNAAIQIVKPVNAFINSTILHLIEDWKLKDKKGSKDEIVQLIFDRIGDIDFARYKWATFFTYGLPYSIGLKNIIPFSYVRLKLWIEFFIINSLVFEARQRMRSEAKFGGAVIFSPEFFVEEETNSVYSILDANNYFTKKLIGPLASIDSLDMHLKEFPFDIFHICSHGGQLTGWSVEQKFKDRFGIQYIIVYDEVLSFSRAKKKDHVKMARKWFPRKLNGFEWNSPNLRSQNYPLTTTLDMFKAIQNAETKDKKIFNRRNIPNSCFIQCIDGFHQGMIRFVASHSSPIVFNNSCWSWFDIAEAMLGSGLRGYIGTLWNVDNRNAKDFANHFYNNLFEKPVINTVHDSLQQLKDTNDQDIYLFWGLHFTTLGTVFKRLDSKIKICTQLLLSYKQWTKKLQVVSNKEIMENILDLRSWVSKELECIYNSNRD